VTDKEVQPAVAVIIAPGGAGSPVRFALFDQAGLTGDVLKMPMHIMQQMDPSIAGNQQVGPAVVVIVGGGHALTISGVYIKAGRMSHLLKRAIAAIAIEDVMGARPCRAARGRSALNRKNIQEPIVIIVQKGAAAPGRFNKAMGRGCIVLIAEA